MIRRHKHITVGERQSGWILWLWWTGATALTGALGWTLSALVGLSTLFIGIVGAGALVGCFVGIAQSWVVLQHGPDHVQPMCKQAWLQVTVIAWGVAFILGILLFFWSGTLLRLIPTLPNWISLTLLLAVPMLGGVAFLSALQWLVLRRYIRGAGWWIPTNMVGWSVGSYIAWISLSDMFGRTPTGEGGISADYWWYFVAAAIATAIANAVTGLVFIILLQKPPQSEHRTS
jgi:hypothetical protein